MLYTSADYTEGSQKSWGAAGLHRRSLADKFLHGAIVAANAYQCTKCQLPSSISFRDKEGETKFDVGATSPLGEPCILKHLRLLHVLGKIKQHAKFQYRISMHDAVMRICISHRLSIIIYVPNKNLAIANSCEHCMPRASMITP